MGSVSVNRSIQSFNRIFIIIIIIIIDTIGRIVPRGSTTHDSQPNPFRSRQPGEKRKNDGIPPTDSQSSVVQPTGLSLSLSLRIRAESVPFPATGRETEERKDSSHELYHLWFNPRVSLTRSLRIGAESVPATVGETEERRNIRIIIRSWFNPRVSLPGSEPNPISQPEEKRKKEGIHESSSILGSTHESLPTDRSRTRSPQNRRRNGRTRYFKTHHPRFNPRVSPHRTAPNSRPTEPGGRSLLWAVSCDDLLTRRDNTPCDSCVIQTREQQTHGTIQHTHEGESNPHHPTTALLQPDATQDDDSSS